MLPSLKYGDIELSSYCRTTAYIDAGLTGSCWKRCEVRDKCCCGTSVGGYVDPATDEAPWFDIDQPCSTDFHGLIIESVKYGDPYRAKIKDTLNGGIVQTRNMRARELTVRGWLAGSSECGIQYGLDWLNSALDPVRCAKDCTKPDLEVYTCCDLTDQQKGRRVLKNVSPISGVKELTPDDDFRCCRTQVEFKLAAESPYFFRDPVEIAADVVFDAEVCPNWCCPSCTGDIIFPDCLSDDLQTRSVALGQASGSCYCEPLFAFSQCVEVPASGSLNDFLNWELTAGSDLVNVSFVFVAQPDGVTVSPLDDPEAYGCERVSKTTAALVPAGYSLGFDSASGNTFLSDPDGGVAAAYGIGSSGPIELGCEPGWFCVYADSCNDMAGTVFSVSTVTGSL